MQHPLLFELGSESLWVHYEICPGDPALPVDSANPCSLRRDVAYELHLRRGTSSNFGNDPMIQSAREVTP